MEGPTVLAVGLGPAGPELVTAATTRALAEAAPGRLFLRTSVHPSAPVALEAGARTFDHLYEEEDSFAGVYTRMAEELIAAAQDAHRAGDGPVVFAVPGSPRVAEATVARLTADPRVQLRSLPALSFLDLVWDRLGVDPLAGGVLLVDAAAFRTEAAGHGGPLLVAQCWSAELLSEVKLARPDDPDPTEPSRPGSSDGGGDRPDGDRAVLLHHLGLDDEVVAEVAWAELDRHLSPDHLTSLWVPRLGLAVGAEMIRLEELVRTLRQRCPWDRQQTHASLTRHLLEESYEVLEAIEELPGPDGEPTAEGYAHLEEELGDLLFQVYFHAVLGAEAGQFSLADVARGVHDKLVVRHPHVFGDVEAETPEAVAANWEVIKRAEKGRDSALDGLPGNLPALSHAAKAQRKAASVGFDWPSIEGPLGKVVEELGELRHELAARPPEPGSATPAPAVAAELGDLLFAAVNVARHAGVDPEAALRASTLEFVRRFRVVEAWARGEGIDLAGADPALVDAQWERAKRA